MPLMDPDIERFGLCISVYFITALRYTITPSRTRDTIFASIFLCLLARVLSLKSSNATNLVAVTGQFENCLSVIKDFIIINPEQSRRRDQDREGYDITKELSKWEKWKWGFGYVCNSRGVGWNWKVAGVPDAVKLKDGVKMSRKAFLWDIFKRWLKVYLIMDLGKNYRLMQPFYNGFGMKEGFGSSADGGMGRRFANGMVIMILGYASLQFAHTGAAFVAVLLGITKPDSWPSINGDIMQTHTLRHFWGRFWHQIFRDTFNIYSKVFLDFLRLTKGTYIYRYTQLYTIFFISFIIHLVMLGSLPYPNGIPVGKNTPWKGSDQFVFFMLQAFAIHVEDTIIDFYKRNFDVEEEKKDEKGRKVVEKKMWMKILGWSWLVLWFGLTATYLTDEFTIGGLDEEVATGEWSPLRFLRDSVEMQIDALSKETA